jgi:hypothetical protein
MFRDVLAYLSQPTAVSSSDLPMLALVTIAYAFYRRFMTQRVFDPLGRAAKVKYFFKWRHRSFDLLHYSVSGFIGLCALARQPYGFCVYWARDCGGFLSQRSDGFVCSIFEKVYYLLFTAYYIVDFWYTHTVSEPTVYKVHHFVCVAMIFACVVLKSPVVGPSIMLLHDAVDIPLYLGKILLYLGFGLSKDIALVAFVLLCTWFRIINFPIIIYHCLQQARRGAEHQALYNATCGLLCAMYALHIVWEVKILRNVIGVLRGGGIHDDRSD